MPERTADPDLLKLYSFGLFTQLSGAVTAGMIHLGDKLGLFAALAAAGEPVTAGELAASTGLDERWVREWAYNQAAAKIISVDDDGDGAAASGALPPEPRGGRRARLARPRGVRHGDVPPLSADDGGARTDAGELPHRARPRLRQPRARRRGRDRAQLRTVEPSPPAARRAAGPRRGRAPTRAAASTSPTSGAGPGERCC